MEVDASQKEVYKIGSKQEAVSASSISTSDVMSGNGTF